MRLTLLYTAVLAVTLLAFGVTVYAISSHNQHRDIDNSLAQRAQIECPVPGGNASPTPISSSTAPAAAPAPSPPARPRAPRVLPLCMGLRYWSLAARASGSDLLLHQVEVQLTDPSIYEEIVDSRNAVLFRSSNLDDQTLPPPKNATQQHYETIHISKGSSRGELRLLVWPIPNEYMRDNRAIVVLTSDGQQQTFVPPFTLLLARSLNDVNASLSRLELALLVGSAVCVLTAAGAGWLLARNALLPIDRLTAEARRIGQRQDFSRRVPYRGPQDEVGRLAATFNTMLDRLESAYARQLRALEAQRRFVADASHELRTPLTTIRGNVELLRLDANALQPDQREALEDVVSETERMSRLVNNLLELARADAGFKIRRDPVPIQPVIDEVLARAARRASGVALESRGAVDATVAGDRDYLVQLLTILVDNALKYTPPGGHVEVAPAVTKETLRIAVRDTGPGIPPEHQAHVFDRFYRADPSRHGEGTGLGLAIARWIARELGGDIVLESVVGQGSTFTIILPVLEARPSPASERAVPAAPWRSF